MKTPNRNAHDYASRRILCWWTDQVVPTLAVVLTLTSVLALSACENLTGSSEETAATPRAATDLSAALSDVAETAELDPDQVTSIRETAARYEGKPGASWYLAADLHDQLSQEQIDHLLTRMKERREQLRQRLEQRREEGAEGPLRRRFHHRRGNDHLRADLDLTDAQKEELKAIREKYGGQMHDLFESLRDRSATEEDREQFRELRQHMREAMKSVLTDQQRQQLEEHRQETKERREEAMEERRAEREAIRSAMDEALELTDEQQEQLQDLWSEHTRENADDRPLGPRPFKSGDFREEISSILTDEQNEIAALHHAISMHGRRGPQAFHRFHGEE